LFGYINKISSTSPSQKLDSTITQDRTLFVHDISILFDQNLPAWRNDLVLQHVDYYNFTTNIGYCHEQLRNGDVAERLKGLILQQETGFLAEARQRIVHDTFGKVVPGVWDRLQDAFKSQGIELNECRIQRGRASVILDFRKCRIEVSIPAGISSKKAPSYLTLERYNGSRSELTFRLPLKNYEVTALPDQIRKLMRLSL
jgi:hypothetical protein